MNTGAPGAGNHARIDDCRLINPAWDAFLKCTPAGEYQQSSLWAVHKTAEGWQCRRVLITANQNIAGGFQLFWRKTRFGRIGYVSKGPVLAGSSPAAVGRLTNLLIQTARRLKLRAMIVQPPARSDAPSTCTPRQIFAPNYLTKIISATLRVDVTKGIPALEARMRRTTRQQIRRAQRAGVQVQIGSEKDVALFFNLMLEACKRQKTAPNPASAQALLKLWHAARETGAACRLTFAEWNGKVIAGLFCIPYGDTLHIWKKGSLPEFLRLHAMELLYRESFQWAHVQGLRYCDFGALDRGIAAAILKRLPMPQGYEKGRDVFNLGFGGEPVLLPPALVYFPNPLIRRTYQAVVGRAWFREKIQKMGLRRML